MSFMDPDQREAWAKQASIERAMRDATPPRLLIETDRYRAVLLGNGDLVFERATVSADALGAAIKVWSEVGTRLPEKAARGEVPWWIRDLIIDGRRP